MKSFLLLFFLPFFNASPIPYRQLQWSDYRAMPPVTAEQDALTCTNIIIKSDTAYAVFYPERSWMRTNDEGLLRHEQIHFAITKGMAAMITRALREGRREAIDGLIGIWRQREWQYDCETNHGQDTTAQKRWEEMIKM